MDKLHKARNPKYAPNMTLPEPSGSDSQNLGHVFRVITSETKLTTYLLVLNTPYGLQHCYGKIKS